MLRSLCVSIKKATTVGILLASFVIGTNVAAQTSTCSVHDQICIYHGLGRPVGYEPTGISSLTATANWDQNNDGDLHALLPQSETYSAPSEAIPGYPLNISAPFFPNVTGSHIYPNHYGSEINGGDAIALHSGDDGGGLATYAGQPGCGGLQTSVSCEAIIVAGEVPGGVYSYSLHAFPDTGTTFGLTNFDISVQAQGNMVLVVNDPNYIDPETGYVHQVGTYQGVNSVTSRLDVFALNVGHAGHVGGVTNPQPGGYVDSLGAQQYYPANPQDIVGLPTVSDQIAMAFDQRDSLIDTYEVAREAEKRRRWLAHQAYLRQQREIADRQAALDREIARLASIQATNDFCSRPNGVCANSTQLQDYAVLLNFQLGEDLALTSAGSLLEGGQFVSSEHVDGQTVYKPISMNNSVGLQLDGGSGELVKIPGGGIATYSWQYGFNPLEIERDEIEFGLNLEGTAYAIATEPPEFTLFQTNRSSLTTSLNSGLLGVEGVIETEIELSTQGLELEGDFEAGAYIAKMSLPINYAHVIDIPLSQNQALFTVTAEPYVAAGLGVKRGAEVDFQPKRIKARAKVGATYGLGAGIDAGFEMEIIQPNDDRYVK